MSLSPGEWARVEALFPQLLELHPAERAALLMRECAREPAVRAEIEAMLSAAEGRPGLIDAKVELSPRRDLGSR